MKAEDKIRQKKLGFIEANHGEKPTSVVVSWDVYKELRESRGLHNEMAEDRLFGMLLSTLQGTKSNQILLFK